jgi:hypothetical protein
MDTTSLLLLNPCTCGKCEVFSALPDNNTNCSTCQCSKDKHVLIPDLDQQFNAIAEEAAQKFKRFVLYKLKETQKPLDYIVAEALYKGAKRCRTREEENEVLKRQKTLESWKPTGCTFAVQGCISGGKLEFRFQDTKKKEDATPCRMCDNGYMYCSGETFGRPSSRDVTIIDCVTCNGTCYTPEETNQQRRDRWAKEKERSQEREENLEKIRDGHSDSYKTNIVFPRGSDFINIVTIACQVFEIPFEEIETESDEHEICVDGKTITCDREHLMPYTIEKFIDIMECNTGDRPVYNEKDNSLEFY